MSQTAAPAQVVRSSHTECQAFLNCRRLWQHRYLNKVETRKRPVPLVMGGAVHAFLEHFYKFKGENLEQGFTQLEKGFDSVPKGVLSPDEVKELETQRCVARGMAETYAKVYSSDFHEFDSFLLEEHAEITLPSGHRYHGYIDTLARDSSGSWWIIETKTAAFMNNADDYFTDVQINSQIAGYMHLAKEILGSFPEGVIYNVLFKTRIRPKVGEGFQAFLRRVQMEYAKYYQTKPYFRRERVIIGKRQLDRWYKNTNQVLQDMSEAVTHKRFYQNTHMCKNMYGGKCEFLDACLRGTYSKLLYQKRIR